MSRTPSEGQDALRQSILGEDCAGKRLDQALCEVFPEYSRSRLQLWLKENKITVDGAYAPAKQRVRGGERIELRAQVTLDTRLVAQPIAIDVI